MYSLRNIAQQEPANIVGVFMLGLNFLAILGVFHITVEQLAAMNGFLIPAFNLFYVRPLTASKSAINELAGAAPAKPARKNA